jgi:serine/threonine protein kinase
MANPGPVVPNLECPFRISMVGRTVSHYQITERLGAGGMGEIYKAQDTRLNRTVAIKVLAAHAGTGELRRRRFLQEAQAASALNHPNIITIHDIVSEGETEFLVMEFVAGQTLGELIPKGGLPVPQVLDYAMQMAGALGAAHAAGIVHRDLKPGNVMVTGPQSGHPGLVKILDFGLAKLTSRAPTAPLSDETLTLADTPLTIEGSIMGTVSYMSPEQAEGKPVDARSDIFTFGAILHEMVTGERAFGGDSAISTLTAILRDEARPMVQIAAEVSPGLQHIAWRSLRKNREDRWQSMEEVRAALVALKRDSDSGMLLTFKPPSGALPTGALPASAPPPTTPPPTTTALPVPGPPAVPKKSRRRVVLMVVGVVLLYRMSGCWRTGRHTPPSVVISTPGVSVSVPGAGTSSIPPKTAGDGVLTNDGVLRMVNAEVAPKLIVEHIRSSKTRFNLSTSEIVRLTEADVPAEVIEAMREATRPAAVQDSIASNGVPAPAAPAPPVAESAVQTVAVFDGLPIPIRLAEDVPAGAPAGTPLRFTVVREFRMGPTAVVAEGAVVTGEVATAGNRVMYRLKDVDTVAGGKLALRATSRRRGDESRRITDVLGGAKPPKNLAAAAGSEYLAYVAGAQTVTVPK